MARKKQTHSVGFNVTKITGRSGIYVFCNEEMEFLYVGLTHYRDYHADPNYNNWKRRLSAHNSHKSKKLTSDVKYMYVLLLPDHLTDLESLVIEYMLIWYINPERNNINYKKLWFDWELSEEEVKKKAKERHKFCFDSSIYELLISHTIIPIEREYNADGSYKRYANSDADQTKIITCKKKRGCKCVTCSLYRRHRKVHGYKKKKVEIN